VLVGVAGVGVPAVIVETVLPVFVGFDCTGGGGVAFGGCVAMGVGVEVGSGVGTGVGVEVGLGVGVGVGLHKRIHTELIAWVTVTPVIPLNVDTKSA